MVALSFLFWVGFFLWSLWHDNSIVEQFQQRPYAVVTKLTKTKYFTVWPFIEVVYWSNGLSYISSPATLLLPLTSVKWLPFGNLNFFIKWWQHMHFLILKGIQKNILYFIKKKSQIQGSSIMTIICPTTIFPESLSTWLSTKYFFCSLNSFIRKSQFYHTKFQFMLLRVPSSTIKLIPLLNKNITVLL